jgi:hypothetical protein
MKTHSITISILFMFFMWMYIRASDQRDEAYKEIEQVNLQLHVTHKAYMKLLEESVRRCKTTECVDKLYELLNEYKTSRFRGDTLSAK